MSCLTKLIDVVGRPASALAVLVLTLAWSGCGQPATDTAETPPEAAAVEHDHDHEHDGEAHGDEVTAAMSKLSAEDRALAESLKVCVVSGEPLGSMGTPIKVEHDGQVAFLCCKGCLGEFESDPEGYLSKLNANSEPGADASSTEEGAAGDAPADGT